MTNASRDLAEAIDAPKMEFRKPFLLNVAMVLFSFVATMLLIFVPFLLLSNSGSYTINGAAVTRDEFMARSHVFTIGLPLLGIYIGAMAYALHQQRPWSRPLLAIYVPMVGILTMLSDMEDRRIHPRPDTAGDTPIMVAAMVFVSLFALWYLYRKRAVVSYYRAIQSQDLPSSS